MIALLDKLLPLIEVLPVESGLHAAAAQARYRESLPSGTSFVDQVSFGVIEAEGSTPHSPSVPTSMPPR